jgi:hypothetical protein
MTVLVRTIIVAWAFSSLFFSGYPQPLQPVPSAAPAKPVDVFSSPVPSGGIHTTIMPVTKWGRYSLRCAGQQPVSLSISDRRSGVIARDGDPGQTNPRIDLFLDRGEYKLVTQGIRKATGTTIITATPFMFPDGFQPAYLVPLRENHLQMNDMQQIFFWFETLTDTTVYVEACGRNLDALVLWRDGEWLVETANKSFIARPKPETPLSGISLSARVPKGTYMVAAYGGKGISWSTNSSDHSLCIKAGFEDLPANFTTMMTVPFKGYTKLFVDPSITSVVVEESGKNRLLAQIQRISKDFEPSGILAIDSISGTLSTPRILLQPQSVNDRNGYRVLTISGTPGQSFLLQTFGPSTNSISGRDGAAWWVTSLTTGNYNDQIGSSGIVVDRSQGSIVAMQADTVSADRTLAKRFNLLSPVTSFVWVETEGKYSVIPGGTDYQWRLSRYFYSPPPNYAEPGWLSGNQPIELTRGLYQLECNPSNKGIATFIMQKASLIGNVIAAGKAAIGTSAGKQVWNAPVPSINFPGITPSSQSYYEVVLNSQSPELSSISCRKTPINPDTPFGLWCKPGQKIQVPITLPGPRVVSIIGISGSSVPFEIKGKACNKPTEFQAGAYTVSVTASGSVSQNLVLKSQPPEMLPSGNPPPFPDEKRMALTKFPSIATGKTEFLDLDREAKRPYAIKVSEPGLYRIETTGRLRTQLELRDRFLHFNRSVCGNGIGRNALLTEYLLPGEYQVTVSAADRSAGRLGIAVYRNALLDGGALEPNIDNRNFVEPFSGAAYFLRIPATGRYRVESIGQNGNFSMRLEDSNGWPFEPAVSDEPLVLELSKSKQYRLISLPTPKEGRRIARLVPILEKLTIKGKGPHPLDLNTTISSTWVDETQKSGGIGTPAIFTFSLPSPITATVSVTSGFKGRLYKANDDSALISWTGNRKTDLTMGNYRITVSPERKNNHAPYQVSVSTRDLIPGLSYDLHKKETLRITIGTASIVELGSQGMLDVAATLYDEDNKTVLAENDDGFLDWNFSVSRALKPGRYFLHVESAEEDFSTTTVFMRVLADTLMDTLAGDGQKPRTVNCGLNRKIGVFPLTKSDTGDIIACAVTGRSRIGCSIEKSTGTNAGSWIPVAQGGGTSPSLSIPRSKGDHYRLKIWSESNTDEKLTVTYLSPSVRLVPWKEAEAGVVGQPERLGNDYRAWFKIDLDTHAPGHIRSFSKKNPSSNIGASTASDSAFTNEATTWFSSTERFCWIELHFEQPGHFLVEFAPLLLENGKPLSMALIGNRPRVFETRLSKNSVALLSAETDGYNPLAGIIATSDAGKNRLRIRGLPVDATFGIGEGRTASISLFSDPHRAAVWNSLPPIDGTQPPVRLSWTELPLIDEGAQNPGVSSWNAARPSARVTHLAKGATLRLRITLPPRSAALVTRADGSRSLECSFDNEPVIREFISDGGDQYLLALDSNAKFDIAAFALSTAFGGEALADQALSPGKGWQVKMARPGMSLLPLASTDNRRYKIFFHGAVSSVGWIGADGGLRNDLANGADVGPGGFIKLAHTEGWIKIDLSHSSQYDEIMACKWGASLAPAHVQEISQAAQFKLGNRSNWFSFVLRDTQHVNFSAPLPLAAIVLAHGKPVNYQEAWELFNWDLPLPPGAYVLGIRPLAGSSLEGGSMSALFRPIQPLSEKKPFTCHIVPGESRLLCFDVAKKDNFGIGLSMAKETVQARLYDVNAHLLEQGKQQFVPLNPGKYYLWLRVPAASEGTEVTARLFGQEPPPNKPPEYLVRWIINGEEGPRPSTESSLDNDNQASQRPSWERFLNNNYGADDEQPAQYEGDNGETREQEVEPSEDETPQEQESGDEESGEGE